MSRGEFIASASYHPLLLSHCGYHHNRYFPSLFLAKKDLDLLALRKIDSSSNVNMLPGKRGSSLESFWEKNFLPDKTEDSKRKVSCLCDLAPCSLLLSSLVPVTGDTWAGNDFMGAVAAMFILSGEDLRGCVWGRESPGGPGGSWVVKWPGSQGQGVVWRRRVCVDR